MLPTEKKIELSFQEGLTQSEIMERMNCPRKHMFRYILNLKKQGSFSWALLTGGAVHKLLEEHYTLLKDQGKGLTEPKAVELEFEPDVILLPEQYEEKRYWELVAGMLVYRHNIYYEPIDSEFDIHEIELPVDLEYRDFRLRGKIDLVASSQGKGRPWIMDHKTASDLGDIKFEGWSFRFQFLFYSWLWKQISGERPSGNFVNILKKPREIRKHNESVDDFLRRIDFNIMADYSKFFRREWLPLDDGMIERFQKYTLDPVLAQFHMIKTLASAEDDDFRNSYLLTPNTDNCCSWNRVCEFMTLCKENFVDTAVEYIERPIKHPELK